MLEEGKRRRIVDFHCHVLPCIDDGSRNRQESVEILLESVSQGISNMVATPHFDANAHGVLEFLEKRKKSLQTLQPHFDFTSLPVMLGAEISYYDGLLRSTEILKLRIEKTKLLLVEMPYQPWSTRMLEDLWACNSMQNTIVVIAHIERYLNYQTKKTWDLLCRGGFLMQANASFFLNPKTRKRAMKMLLQNQIHMLGSDCHNMTSRRPYLGPAVESIAKECGNSILNRLAMKGEYWIE